MADEVKISDLTQRFTAITEEDFLLISEYQGTPGEYESKKIIKSRILGYKSWSGNISQAGTGAPTANELKNDFGTTPTFAYVGGGAYTLTLTGLLTEAKTAVFTGQNGTDVFYAQKEVGNDNVVLLGAPGDDILSNNFLEIRVYY
jgi:hypothetical protein